MVGWWKFWRRDSEKARLRQLRREATSAALWVEVIAKRMVQAKVPRAEDLKQLQVEMTHLTAAYGRWLEAHRTGNPPRGMSMVDVDASAFALAKHNGAITVRDLRAGNHQTSKVTTAISNDHWFSRDGGIPLGVHAAPLLRTQAETNKVVVQVAGRAGSRCPRPVHDAAAHSSNGAYMHSCFI